MKYISPGNDDITLMYCLAFLQELWRNGLWFMPTLWNAAYFSGFLFLTFLVVHVFFVFQSGNYYSLRSQHEKAALYFQRALKLNPRYLGAWTLMGHEYMEMKNTSAAIQAYRWAFGWRVGWSRLLCEEPLLATSHWLWFCPLTSLSSIS